MRDILIRLALNAGCLWLTVEVVRGVEYDGAGITDYLIAGVAFALLNLLIKPILLILSFPALLLSLGLFYFVVNALIFWMMDLLVSDFFIASFWAAFKGSIVFSTLNWVMTWLLGDL